jgi:hypothetical protein
MFISDDLAPLALLFTAETSCLKEISQGSYSPVYGKKESSPVCRVVTRAPLPAELMTMLVPDSEVAAHLGLLRPIESGHKGVPVKAFRYSTANGEDLFFFANASGNWQVGGCASNAKFLYCSTDSNKTVRQFVICGGSYFAFRGRRLFDTNSPVKHSEWSRDAEKPSIFRHTAPATKFESVLSLTEPPRASSEIRQYPEANISQADRPR